MPNMTFYHNFTTYLDSKDDIDDDLYQLEVSYILDRLTSTKTIPMYVEELL